MHFCCFQAKPWKRRILTQSDGGLNLIIRRLKCKNASELFSRSLDSTESNYSTRPKYPYLMRNLEQSVNSWPSFEKKCQEYTKQRSKEETPAEEHVEPISNYFQNTFILFALQLNSPPKKQQIIITWLTLKTSPKMSQRFI